MDQSTHWTESQRGTNGDEQVFLDDELAYERMAVDGAVEGIKRIDLSGLDPVRAAAKLAEVFAIPMRNTAPPEYIEDFKSNYTTIVGAAFALVDLPSLLEDVPFIDLLSQNKWLAWTIAIAAPLACAWVLWPTPEKIAAADAAKAQAAQLRAELERRRAHAAGAGEGDPDGETGLDGTIS